MSHASMTILLAVCINLLTEGIPACLAQPAIDSPPATLSLGQLADLFAPVNFDHQLHVDYASCSECHHHTTGCLPTRSSCAMCHRTSEKAVSVACRNCHFTAQDNPARSTALASGDRYHIDIPGLKGAYHLLCIDCHDTIGTGPLGCNECHTLTAKGKRFYQIRSVKDKNSRSPAPANSSSE